MISDPLRLAVARATRADEAAIVESLIPHASLSPIHRARADNIARTLVNDVRAADSRTIIDSFLQAFGLSTDEGIALMCLAEALLRVPDASTRDRLIADKIGRRAWAQHLGQSESSFVNASAFALMLTGATIEAGRARADLVGTLGKTVSRLGEPVIRQAIMQGMKILGRHFVFGRTIGEALKRGTADQARGDTHSFDMLGEAARTWDDAHAYERAYADAIAAVGARSAGLGPLRAQGISVKLSALHPRYEWAQRDAVLANLLPRVAALAMAAQSHDIGFTIDAEEADRLDLSMDIIAALLADETLFARPWGGFGLALQAYQKRALPLVHWLVATARRHRRTLNVRLVKGAYWDSEVKISQVGGYADYPVFTTKPATDVSYIACARALLAAPDCIAPAFATHNAASIAAIKAIAGDTPFEFQRLHGMGEELYAALRKREGARPTRVRIYAPVGGHEQLLAYLVRRLLENGANSSFVNRLADADLPVEALIADPVAEVRAISGLRHPRIPLPSALFGPSRHNSPGPDLSDPLVREPLLARLSALESWRPSAGSGPATPIRSPIDGSRVGSIGNATPDSLAAALTAAHIAQPGWCARGGPARAAILEKAADLYQADADRLLSLCQREAGKTLPDSIAELREAVDFLRYYAAAARTHFAGPTTLPGPTGEANQLSLHGRGTFAAISPWNFPLAIFTGQVAAALAAGNAVAAKPAEQTPLIAARAVALLHKAGVPAEILALLAGDGATIGAALTAHPLISGVVFTGSTDTARAIAATLAQRPGPILPLIAETGGQNAMIVDSSALPEQVVRDVLASAFQSAGQRCSALRVLFLQADVADTVITMLKGAMDCLTLGDPRDPATDVGPVIDADAKAALEAHAAALDRSARPIHRLSTSGLPDAGHWVAPGVWEIPAIASLTKEHFGPILHIVRWRANDLDAVIDAINATGYGLTLGVHSRIQTTVDRVRARARVGNLYINRNQIGAVVGSQPFGGEGLSGTGPKAGGPHYLFRFATERSYCADTTAAGGNAALMAGL